MEESGSIRRRRSNRLGNSQANGPRQFLNLESDAPASAEGITFSGTETDGAPDFASIEAGGVPVHALDERLLVLLLSKLGKSGDRYFFDRLNLRLTDRTKIG
jgi:hypothetical protein